MPDPGSSRRDGSRREGGSLPVRMLVVVALLSAVAYGAAYGYGWLHTAQQETNLSRRLAEAGGATPDGRPLDEAQVRERLIALARQEGLEVEPEDVTVIIEPLDATNLEKLASYERVAISIAGKLKDHVVGALFLGIRVTVTLNWGPVKRVAVLERNTWMHAAGAR